MSTAVLFFGGEKISLTLARRSVNGTYTAKARMEVPYSGIIHGGFVDNTELHDAIAILASKVGLRRSTSVVVGIPPCFCHVDVKDAERHFTKPTKITPQLLENFLHGGHAVYYKIDGGNALLDAAGYTVNRTLHAQVSRFAMSEQALLQITEALQGTPLKKPIFVPTMLAEAAYLLPEHIRDRTCVLISCGMTYTSIAAVVGDQLGGLETIHMGMAHFINDISVVLKENYSAAKLHMQRHCEKHNPTTATASIIAARLEELGEQLYNAVIRMDKRLLKRPFFICGGNIDIVPNAREFLGKVLDVAISQCVCPYNETNHADQVSRDALISLALHN